MQFVDPALPRDIFGWRSPALGLDMPVVTYGHAGHPLLLFPTAAADFLENERFFLIKSIEPYLFEGRVRVFSIDSINRYAWMDDDLPIREKARRQALYVRYIEEELVPHIRRVSGDRRIATSGASFGAFHAANALFRRPDLFDCVIAMSGFYDLHPGWSEGLSNDDVYFNNPASYLPNLEGEPLDRLRHDCQIHIITGRGEHEAPQRSEQLSRILSAKGIPHNLDMWGYDVNHDWPWWRRMLPHYIGERVGVVKLPGAAALGALAALFGALEVRAQDAPSPASTSAEQAEAQPIEVTIEGDKAPPGAVSLGRKQIQEMPGVLADPYRAIEVEPGVTPLTSGVPFYFVRGAPPGNVGYFFDGIQVPMLFHVGAGPGVIPSALVQRVELHLGPYPASFGRMAGAIVDAESAPARSDWRGEGVMRVVDVGGLVEGPLPDGAGSLLAGGHYAIGAEILSALVPAVDLSYWDYQARGSFKVSERGRLGVLAFGAYDYLATVEGDVRDVLLDSDFHRVDLRYDHELDDGGSLRVSTTLGLDRSRGLGVQDARDTRLHSRVTFKRPLGGGVLLRGGLDVALDVFDVVPGGAQECTTFLCDSGGLGSSTESELAEAFEVLFPSRLDLAVGGWVDALVVLSDRATLTPGLRVDYYHSIGRSDVAVDPKLAGRFGIGDHFRLVPAVGVASQLPGFPPLPGLQIGGIPGGLQRALQTSFGAEGDAGPIDVRGSVFRHATFNLTDAIGARRGQSFGPERFLGRSTGDAYGLELTARGALSSRVFFLASYTLSRTTREIEGLRLPSAYDRTHVAQVAFLSDLGKNWKIGFRSLFYTGFPAEESGSGVEPTTDPERVKPFFRLDARLSKRWVFGERAYVGLVFDVQNATLSKEVFDVTCEDGRCEPREIGPIAIPTMVFEAGY